MCICICSGEAQDVAVCETLRWVSAYAGRDPKSMASKPRAPNREVGAAHQLQALNLHLKSSRTCKP